MIVEMLISTMNRDEMSFLEVMGLEANILIINQKRQSKKVIFSLHDYIVKVINYPEEGLSNSRNRLLENSTGDICVISDDDVVYHEGYVQMVHEAHEKNPDADIIVFQYSEDRNKMTRKSFSHEKWLNRFDIIKVASVEITFKRESIIKSGVSFDKFFGLGSVFASGEENIFLSDCLKKGLKIWYVPQVLCYHKAEIFEWKDIMTELYFIEKGAVFYRMYGLLSYIISLLFLLKKIYLYKGSMKILRAYMNMIRGMNQYRNL